MEVQKCWLREEREGVILPTSPVSLRFEGNKNFEPARVGAFFSRLFFFPLYLETM